MESIDILKMNYDLFKKMKTLAERQETVISEDRIEEFNALLNNREDIRKEVMQNTRRYSSENRNMNRKKEHPETKTLSMKIAEIIKSIQETDKRIEESIISKKTALQQDINNMRKGQNAVKRYGVGQNSIPRFFDKKS